MLQEILRNMSLFHIRQIIKAEIANAFLTPVLTTKRKVINDLCYKIYLIGCTKSDEEPIYLAATLCV